jgi:hypothetical protein
MYRTISDTVITAYDVTEAQFNALPTLLQCVRGDLGRYKASDDKARIILFSRLLERTTPADVAEWLRAQGIRHEIEVAYTWKPGDNEPDLLVPYNDIRESLALILDPTPRPSVLTALDDAITNNLGDSALIPGATEDCSPTSR